jgi:hypothetical protein
MVSMPPSVIPLTLNRAGKKIGKNVARAGNQERKLKRVPGKRENSTMAIELEITHLFDQISIPEDELEELLKVASWQIQPQFPYPGRTAWHVFKKPVHLKNDKEKTFCAAKIKGVGVWNPEKFHLYSGVHARATGEKPVQPSTEDYKFTTSIAHFGFTETGCFKAVYSEPAPFGGMLHRRAVQEYENSHRMLAQGIPAIVSLLVARLPECYKFMDQAMGIVISLSEESQPYRLHLVHFGENELNEPELKYYTGLRQSLGISSDLFDESTRLQTINALSGQIGKLLHDFSAAGLYRHSGGWEDLSFCSKTRQVFLADLDSNRCLAELTPCVRPLQILRDFSSSIHKLLNMFYYPTLLDKYTFSNLAAYDPISKMLSAYFPATNAGEIKRVAARFWDYYAPHYFLMQRYRNQLMGEWDQERRKSYKMDDDIFFTLSMLNLFPLYGESDLTSLYPSESTLDDLREHAQEFLGERYQYVSYLLGD